MQPLDDSTILITGATDGLGRGVALRLAEQGAGTLLLHGRDTRKLATVAEEVDAAGNGSVKTYHADFESLDEVRKLASDVTNSNAHVHTLINNAGIGGGATGAQEREESADGHELRFAVNYLAGLLLTLRLLPELRASEPARIVFVASLGQAPVNFDDVMLENEYNPGIAYAQSKLAQITAGFKLAELLPPKEITVNSLHPATFMPTKIVTEIGADPIDSLEDGVTATVRLASEPDFTGMTGRFFNGLEEERPNEIAYDPEYRDKLWQLSLDLIGESAPA
jgi:NAD(P)-dependent dehydrogenase (short-subunit alcohol dehydrogenase family)